MKPCTATTWSSSEDEGEVHGNGNGDIRTHHEGAGGARGVQARAHALHRTEEQRPARHRRRPRGELPHRPGGERPRPRSRTRGRTERGADGAAAAERAAYKRHGERRARRRTAARPGGGVFRLPHAPERDTRGAAQGAAGRHRLCVRSPSERDDGHRVALPEVRQRGRAARRQGSRPHQHCGCRAGEGRAGGRGRRAGGRAVRHGHGPGHRRPDDPAQRLPGPVHPARRRNAHQVRA